MSITFYSETPIEELKLDPYKNTTVIIKQENDYSILEKTEIEIKIDPRDYQYMVKSFEYLIIKNVHVQIYYEDVFVYGFDYSDVFRYFNFEMGDEECINLTDPITIKLLPDNLVTGNKTYLEFANEVVQKMTVIVKIEFNSLNKLIFVDKYEPESLHDFPPAYINIKF